MPCMASSTFITATPAGRPFSPFATNTTFVPTNPAGSQYVTAPYKPKDNRNQYGFGLGGPIIKDKLFFFYAFDQFKRNFPGTAKANNPGSFFTQPDAALPAGYACNLATGGITAPKGSPAASSVDSQSCLLAARLKYPTYSAARERVITRSYRPFCRIWARCRALATRRSTRQSWIGRSRANIT